ncbi:MAG: fumarylacetoacetate hydrolase family protein, partial [Actinobacteria bacterium]|nr:fumarylacetoacetate hydrolase family protein [Actinomycetota bacterium]
MRIVQYRAGDATGCGVRVGDDVHPTGYPTTLALLEDGERGLAALEAASANDPVAVDRIIHPIRPWKIFGSGINYTAHGEEGATVNAPPAPPEPRFDFIKLSSSIIGPGEPIVIPPADDVIKRGPGMDELQFAELGFAVDYEVELGVVIGKRAKNVRAEDAWDYILGYTVINDVSGRSVQLNYAQADLGKSFDTFCPMGPCIVTKDELPYVLNVRIRSHVNGELRQDAVISDQLFPPPVAIEWLSSIITLDPGDVISTGTPGGIGLFRDPPAMLQPGDTVTVSATGIGEVTNPV